MKKLKKKIKAFFVDISKKSNLFRNLFRTSLFIKNRIRSFKHFFKSIDDKLIVFESYMGRRYDDSPKAIYEYMIKNKKYKDYKFVWFFKHPSKYKYLENNRNTLVFGYGGKQYYKYYGISKYWVTNSRIPDAIIKKSDQIYIQCWHGTPLKRLGYDISVKGGNAMNSIKDIRHKYKVDSKKYTYMLSPSKFCSDKFISAFNLREMNKEHIIIEKGYPRNDFLSTFTKKDIDKIKKELNIPNNKKIILYAPTWRDNQHQSGVGYTYKTEVDFDFLKSHLSEEYIILFRAHYFVANNFDFEKYEGFIYNVSNYDIINNLYIISDILITDYSSVFFDYSILKRPMIFYMYDLDVYKSELRDFYFNIDELPGPIVKDEQSLVESIKNTKKFKYDKKYKAFNEKYTYLDDGLATKRVVEEIIK